MANYRELIVWQKAMLLVEEIYRLVKSLPKEETYALSDQMRRAAVSIPSNIAEGHGRDSDREFSRFLSIAQGSRAELETQVEIFKRLRYITEAQLQNVLALTAEVEKMLLSMSRKLNDHN